MKTERMDRRIVLFLYILSFILLREWLMPIVELTDTDFVGIFLLFIILSLALGFFGMRYYISIPVKLAYIFFALQFAFNGSVIPNKEQARGLTADLFSNIGILAGGRWEEITNPFRTVLFFVLLWMTIYLIRHWIEVRKNIIVFYIMTVIFVAFLDTFTVYSAETAIFRIMITGLLLTGLLYIHKLYEKDGRRISAGALTLLSLPLLFTLTISGAFASFMPEKEPAWPDPVPFIQQLTSGEGVGLGAPAVSKTGYDPDDSQLGGPFMNDDTVVFKAKVPKRQYWKIETKDTYTTKGWEQSGDASDMRVYTADMDIDENRVVSGGDPLELKADIRMLETLPYLAYPYGTKTINAGDQVLISRQMDSGKLSAVTNSEKIEVDQYSVQLHDHKFSLKELQGTRMEDYRNETADFSPYLQLPDQLPDRVKELAASVADGEDSVYEKAKAIERYFSRNGFVYDQMEVAVPMGDEDYVDQFLFDTKKGYCDNFSSSMVVMLRAVDIPARWAKGFAPGVSKTVAGGREYTITNNEAHSWVEAYIPGFGWMPFEPTIGFTNTASIDYDIDLAIDDPEVPEMEEMQEREEKEKEEAPVPAVNKNNGGGLFGTGAEFIGKYKWILLAAAAAVLLAAFQAYRFRVKWIPSIVVRKHKTGTKDWPVFVKQYRSLLKQLERFGLRREDSMTLTEYAQQVDAHFGGNRMIQLTRAYERGLYGGQTERAEWQSLQEIWEDLINRATG